MIGANRVFLVGKLRWKELTLTFVGQQMHGLICMATQLWRKANLYAKFKY